MSHRLPCLVLACTLLCTLSGCRKQRPREPLVQRDSLRLTLKQEAYQAPEGPVQPSFLSFEKLAAAVKPRWVAPQVIQPDEDPDAPPPFIPEAEPNNDMNSATVVTVPALIQGHADPLLASEDGDHDWYSFFVERDKPAVMAIELSGVKKIDLVLELYHDSMAGRNRLFALDNSAAGEIESLPNLKLMNGRYFLHVFQRVPRKKKPRFDVVAPYHISFGLSDYSEAHSETEPNDNALTAVPVSVPADITGLVNSAEDQDWYLLDLLKVSAYSYLVLELLPDMKRTLELEVFTGAMEPLAKIVAEDGRKVTVPNLGLLEGSSSYFLVVRAVGGKQSRGKYTLTVRSQESKDRVELEPDNSRNQAMRLFWEEPLTGWLGPAQDEDWFRLEPVTEWGSDDAGKPEIPALNVMVSGVSGVDIVLEVLEADGEILLGRFDSGPRSESEEVPNMAMPKGPIYLKVYAKEGENTSMPYTIQARAVLTEGREVEPNNVMEQANPVSLLDGPVQGWVSQIGDRDCFEPRDITDRVQIQAPDKVEMTVSSYGPDGQLLFQGTAGSRPLDVPLAGPGSRLCLWLKRDSQAVPRSNYVIRSVGE